MNIIRSYVSSPLILVLYPKKKYSDEILFFSLGALLAGLSFCLISDLIFFGFRKEPLIYAMLAWGSIRFIQILHHCFSLNHTTKNSALSLAILVYCFCLCFLGALGGDIPFSFLIYGLSLDILFFILLKIQWFLSLSFLSVLLAGFFLNTFFSISLIGSTKFIVPWASYFVEMGIGASDTLRDAALIRSWYEYKILSPGIHGLLSAPYPNLFVFFHSGFLHLCNGNAVAHLQYFTYIFAPPCLIYLTLTMFPSIVHPSLHRYQLFILYCLSLYLLPFGQFTSQQSTFMATFLTLACLPLLFQAWKNHFTSILPLILLCIMAPLLMYSHSFPGLIYITMLAPLILYRSAQRREIFAFLVCCLGSLALFFLYDDSQRNTEIQWISFFKGWLPSLPHFNPLSLQSTARTNLLIITVCLIFFLRQSLKKRKYFSLKKQMDTPKIRILLFGLTAAIGGSFSFLLANNNTDIFYISIFMSWILIFVFLSRECYGIVQKNIRSLIKIFVQWNGFSASAQDNPVYQKRRYFVCKIMLGGMLVFSVQYFYIPQFKLSIKFYEMILEEIPARFFLSSVNRTTCTTLRYDPLCEYRKKILNVGDIPLFNQSFYPTNIGKIVREKSQFLKGSTGVYIAPTNPYWTVFISSSDEKNYPHIQRTSPENASLYFMAVHGIPLIFGVNSKDIGYSFPYLALQGGTLKSLQDIEEGNGTHKNLCHAAQQSFLDNVILFYSTNLDTLVLECKPTDEDHERINFPKDRSIAPIAMLKYAPYRKEPLCLPQDNRLAFPYIFCLRIPFPSRLKEKLFF